jgi:hypothetical protein
MSPGPSRTHPQLGAWRATYAVDPVVLWHLRRCRPAVVLAGLLLVVAVAAPLVTRTAASIVLLVLPAVVFFVVCLTRPTGKSILSCWWGKAMRGRHRGVELYADGFVLTHRGVPRRACRWDDVTALRHPLFRAVWRRDEDEPCYTQKAPPRPAGGLIPAGTPVPRSGPSGASRLVVGLAGGEVVEFSDLLADVETLNEAVQREVYPRLLEKARRRLTEGQAVGFGPFEITAEGLRYGGSVTVRLGVVDIAAVGLRHGGSFVSWQDVESLQLTNWQLTLKRRGDWAVKLLTMDMSRLPNFPVLVALLEEVQPDLACDLLEGLRLDAEERLWQRASALRLAAPGPPAAGSTAAAANGGAGRFAEGPAGPADAAGAPATEGVPDHTGRPNRSTADFFAPPPPEIGPLVSACATLKAGDRPFSPEARALIILLAAGGAGLAGLAFALIPWFVSGGLPPAPFLVFWMTVPSAVGAAVAWVQTRFAHTCTYVGTRGLARYRCAGRRDRLIERSVFLFKDAAALRSAWTRRYRQKVYQGSDYAFEWLGPRGEVLFRVKGPRPDWLDADEVLRYVRQGGQGNVNPAEEGQQATDPRHFGEAAEVAWSLYRLDFAQAELERPGCVRFALRDGGEIRVGPGFLDFGAPGGRCGVEDLAGTTLKEIKTPGSTATCDCCGPRTDALSFHRRGSLPGVRVDLSGVADVKLFLFLLRTLVAFGSAGTCEAPAGHATPADVLDQLADAARVPWGNHARATAFVCKSLGPDAAERALRHLRLRSG